jgi:hypothetical protein
MRLLINDRSGDASTLRGVQDRQQHRGRRKYKQQCDEAEANIWGEVHEHNHGLTVWSRQAEANVSGLGMMAMCMMEGVS